VNELFRWFSGGGGMPGSPGDLRWSWVTIVLSLVIATGYVVIAVERHFQAKLARVRESKASFARLRNIVLCSAVLGTVFYVTDMFWLAWRLYDVVLVGLAWHTWSFALRARGPGLVDERLARVSELERSANRYREIAELMPEILWTATGRGGVDFSNRRWAEFAGDGRTWLEAVHPDDRAQVLEWWERAVAGREPASREVRLVGAGGGYRTFLVKATPVAEGDSLKWLGACADIDDQRRLAEEKESQGKRKMFFLNALSHDLRAPLNNVVLNAHLLKTTARGAAESESATAIVENAVAAGDLVSKLLDFAKVDGQEQNMVEPVSLAETLRQIVRRFVPVADPKGLFLRVVAECDVELHTDRQKLDRIVTNLVDNAIKFTDRGGVTIELTDCEGGATLRVSDTGMGVAAEHAPHLFDEFYQVNNPKREPGKGFGMGLAICRSLARQLDGDIRLASTGPGGTTFELRLGHLNPAPATPQTAKGGKPAAEPDDGAVCFA
jgi:PAS domain S-box-containing protein